MSVAMATVCAMASRLRRMRTLPTFGVAGVRTLATFSRFRCMRTLPTFLAHVRTLTAVRFAMHRALSRTCSHTGMGDSHQLVKRLVNPGKRGLEPRSVGATLRLQCGDVGD